MFVSHASKDRELKDELLKHLVPLQRIGVEVWDADQAQVGEDWHHEMEEMLARAHVAILLMSADFLASDFLQNVEVPRIFGRREKDGLQVIPVVLRSCSWTSYSWIGKLKPLPLSGKSIAANDGDLRDQVMTEVVEEIVRRAKIVGASTGGGKDFGNSSAFGSPPNHPLPDQPNVDLRTLSNEGDNPTDETRAEAGALPKVTHRAEYPFFAPPDAISVFRLLWQLETWLRYVIYVELRSSIPSWQESIMTITGRPQPPHVSRKHENFSGPAGDGQTLFSSLTLPDMTRIVLSNWSIFKDYFPPRDATRARLREI